MTPKEVIQKIINDNTINLGANTNQSEKNLLDRIAHKFSHGIDIVGKDRVLLGQFYKKLYNEWPYEEGPEDIERRQTTAKFLLEAFENAVESGVIELTADRKNFLHRMEKFLEAKKEIQKKDFNFLFYLSKQYDSELKMFLGKKIA